MAKMIEQEKKWFVKEPAKLEEILEAAGLLAKNELIVKAIYADINRLYSIKSYVDTFIRKSVIVSHFTKKRRFRVKLVDTVLANKWLFYTQQIEGGSDVLIQPIFDMEKMTERKINSLIKAITNNDYEKVKKLVPNNVAKFDKYSCCLFNEEEVNADSSDSIHNSLSSAPARDGSELTPQNEQEKTETKGQLVDHELDHELDQALAHAVDKLGTAPIISTRVDAKENRDKRIGEKENRELNIEGRKDKGPLVRETESEPSLPPYQKTELDLITKQRLWKDYLANLKVDSKEMQALLNYAGEDRPMIENNFELFKFHLLNRTDFRRKDECPLTASDAGKNEYIYTLFKNSSERRNIVKHIQESIEAKRKRDFVQGKPGYPFDFFNKKGQRISGDRIVPDDAPPRPSDEHFWNGKFWNHR